MLHLERSPAAAVSETGANISFYEKPTTLTLPPMLKDEDGWTRPPQFLNGSAEIDSMSEPAAHYETDDQDD